MRRISHRVARTIVAASLAVAITMAISLPTQTQAATGGATIRSTGLLNPSAASTIPIAYIAKVGASAIYYPSYLSTCVATATPAWAVYNTTVTTQTVTDLVSGTVVATIPPNKAAGFVTASPHSAGFYLQGLRSNGTTALVVKCS